MKTVPRFLYLLCFLGLAVTATLALDRVVQPAMSYDPPALGHRRRSRRRARPHLPQGSGPSPWSSFRSGATCSCAPSCPVPASCDGIGGQYHFYVEQLRHGGIAYVGSSSRSPSPTRRSCSSCWPSRCTGSRGRPPSWALSLRKAVPAIALILVLLGFSLTVDTSSRVVWLALLFLVLAACLLVLSRGLRPRGLAAAGRRWPEGRWVWSRRSWPWLSLERLPRPWPTPLAGLARLGSLPADRFRSTASTGCRTIPTSSIRPRTWSS